MKKLQTKKTKQKTSSVNTNVHQAPKLYASDMGIGFRVVNFKSVSAN